MRQLESLWIKKLIALHLRESGKRNEVHDGDMGNGPYLELE
jgi:hypothetical protein